MAYLHGVFFSKMMSRPVHYTAVLCNDNAFGTDGNPHYARPTKNVYLLHGYSGCETDWFTNAPLTDYANRINVNFFLPNGDNNFYLNQPQTGCKYQSYVGEEFVAYTRKTFGLSDRREDTYICGYSMGGYGALHTALSYPETFGKTMALSSALIVSGLKYMSPEDNNPMANYDYYSWVFGDMKNAENTEADPVFLIRKLQAAGTELPDIFLACGTEDFLIQPNRGLKATLDEMNVPVTYVEAPGVHDFNFWRAHLEKGLVWALGE
ncbi:MAG: prolyl oligopeptidase family serine peptidase [Lachnospiraceae bacterium]|nr:prolyl oligopeptidase family serine peptidase [Lachnospiraceae bacterium]